jgi:hypothetical protein
MKQQLMTRQASKLATPPNVREANKFASPPTVSKGALNLNAIKVEGMAGWGSVMQREAQSKRLPTACSNSELRESARARERDRERER